MIPDEQHLNEHIAMEDMKERYHATLAEHMQREHQREAWRLILGGDVTKLEAIHTLLHPELYGG